MDYLNEPSGKVFGSYNLNDYLDIFVIVTFYTPFKNFCYNEMSLKYFCYNKMCF